MQIWDDDLLCDWLLEKFAVADLLVSQELNIVVGELVRVLRVPLENMQHLHGGAVEYI